MVELAIVIVLLVMVVFGITELGRALYQQNALTQAVETGARYLGRARGAVDHATCEKGALWTEREQIARNLVEYGCETPGPACNTPLLPDLSVDRVDVLPPQTLGTEMYCTIRIEASAPFHSVFGTDEVVPFTDLEPLVLRAASEERYVVFTN